MAKVVINGCHGGFTLSEAANKRYVEIKGTAYKKLDCDRTDPALVQVVEELGKDASGRFSLLIIAEVPSGEAYRIAKYDGLESIELRDEIEWKFG